MPKTRVESQINQLFLCRILSQLKFLIFFSDDVAEMELYEKNDFREGRAYRKRVAMKKTYVMILFTSIAHRKTNLGNKSKEKFISHFLWSLFPYL